ncbi:MAG: hypothetical protein KA257_11475 [Opitutaceae bacterium]|nr:hypothetical protein [Opitutaceae bacterium]
MSSNAEPAGATPFQVSTRDLSEDFSSVGASHSVRDLGALGHAQFTALLGNLLAIDAMQLLDGNPHLLVTAKRGRFTVQPSKGKLMLREAGQPNASFMELSAAEVPDWLDQRETTAGGATNDSPAATAQPGTDPRRAQLVALLFAVTLIALAVSVYFTFIRTAPIDADVSYTEVPAAQLATLRPQVLGSYTTLRGDCTLDIRADGTLVYGEADATAGPTETWNDNYTFALRDGVTPVLRMKELGPVEIVNAQTVLYAGDTYTRKN